MMLEGRNLRRSRAFYGAEMDQVAKNDDDALKNFL